MTKIFVKKHMKAGGGPIGGGYALHRMNKGYRVKAICGTECGVRLLGGATETNELYAKHPFPNVLWV